MSKLKIFLTGANEDGGVQSDPDLSLGGFRSSNVLNDLDASDLVSLTGVTINSIADANESGIGKFRYYANARRLSWASVGELEGTRYDISSGGVFLLSSRTLEKEISITVEANDLPVYDVSEEIIISYSPVQLFDDVNDAQRVAGDISYRAVALYNDTASDDIANINIYMDTNNISATYISSDGDITESEDIVISTALTIDSDVPYIGLLKIDDELMSYNSRESNSFNINKRGIFDTTPVTHIKNTKIQYMYPYQLGLEDAADTLTMIVSEHAVPSGIDFYNPYKSRTGLKIDTLSPNSYYGLWIKRQVPEDTDETIDWLLDLSIDYESPELT